MNLKEDISDPIFSKIGEIADELGREVYVVGGLVRDIFLQRQSKDYDFVTVGSGIELATEVAKDLATGRTCRYSPTMARHKSRPASWNWNS